MTDVINLCVKVTICLGGILDLIVTGLGSILTRMVAVIYKIGCCVYGWGDRSICTKEYNSQVGVNGDASEYKDIINLYRLQNCKTDVITIINKYTGGKDISKQTDVISIILQKILIIVDIINSGHITKQHFTICFVEMISIFGCVINSYSKGSGTTIVQKVIPVCGPHFVKQGCPDIREEKTRIVTVVTVGNNARIDWNDIQTRSKSDDLTIDVKVVFEDKGSNPSLQQVFNLEAPSSFDGSVSFLLKLLHALGTVIDVVCNGLGKLVVRIVGLLIHYIVAILGRGRNSRSFVCQKAYFDSFGITVKSSDWADLVTGFKLGSCKQDLDAIVAAQKGKDNAVIRVILDCTSSLVSIILKGPKITESDFTDVFSYSFTIFAAFANSCKPDLGKKICERLVPICSSILEKNNYPALTAHQPNIVKKIAVCNNVKVAWVAKTTVVEH
ncbi:uncharacterized protein LOC133532801 [Cydia pomonella]|uniref:uncharacterized protein LOC133532801 n=1 Tax=Cydia pomonella TaxID=82600 RepID=UPI002ADD3959|nr:uncharacterized protein LOC133532801 [Cydia pomonella]